MRLFSAIICSSSPRYQKQPVFTRSFQLKISLTALLLIISSCGTPYAGSAAEHASTSKAPFVQKIINGYGGETALKRHFETPYHTELTAKSLSTISTASNSTSCIVLNKGKKQLVKRQFLGQPLTVCFDGHSSWRQTGNWVTKGTEASTRILAEEAGQGLNILPELLSSQTQLAQKGNKSCQGKSCTVLEITTQAGTKSRLYVDSDTGLILRCEYDSYDYEQGMPAVKATEYSDYRKINGIPVPFKTKEYTNNTETASLEVLSSTIDRSVTDESFSMPAESFYKALKKAPLTIPFEYLGNLIVVDLKVGNAGNKRFIVDTGASQTIIDKKLASQIGPSTTPQFNITSGIKAMTLPHLRLPALKLGSLTVEDTTALISDLSHFKSSLGEEPDGLLGANILNRFLVTINYAEHKIVLADPVDGPFPRDTVSVKMAPVFGAASVVVPARIDNKENLNFLIDTGASFNTLPRNTLSRLYKGSLMPVGEMMGLDNHKIKVASIRLKNIQLGEIDIPAPVFSISLETHNHLQEGLFTAPRLGILGNPALSKTTLTIDYRNDRILLAQHSQASELADFEHRIEQAVRLHLRTNRTTESLRSLDNICKQAQSADCKAAEALALAASGDMLCEKFKTSKEHALLQQAEENFVKAGTLAKESRNRQIEARVLAAWGLSYLISPRSAHDLDGAGILIKRALAKNPSDAKIYSSLAAVLIKRAGHSDKVARLVDQALILDPSDWHALWIKHQEAARQGNKKEQKLIEDQLALYYSDIPKVQQLNTPNAIKSSKAGSRSLK